jgi:hypothetical protein
VNSSNATDRILVVTGIGLIALAAAWFLGGLAGVLPPAALEAIGNPGLRINGGVAIAGCLLAAIGSRNR